MPHLEGLDESPKKGANALPSAEELDQPHDSKETKEGDGDASAVLCVLWRNRPESEDRRAKVYVVNTEYLAVLYGMRRSELRPLCQIHMGYKATLHLCVMENCMFGSNLVLNLMDYFFGVVATSIRCSNCSYSIQQGCRF